MRKARVHYPQGQGVHTATIFQTVEDMEKYMEEFHTYNSIVSAWREILSSGRVVVVNGLGGYFCVAKERFEEMLVEWVEK
jgi:hypothetical protein